METKEIGIRRKGTDDGDGVDEKKGAPASQGGKEDNSRGTSYNGIGRKQRHGRCGGRTGTQWADAVQEARRRMNKQCTDAVEKARDGHEARSEARQGANLSDFGIR
jgi:hypothetical protein